MLETILGIDVRDSLTQVAVLSGLDAQPGNRRQLSNDPEAPPAVWTVRTAPRATDDELLASLRAQGAECGVDWASIAGCVVSSTVPVLRSAYRRVVERLLGERPIIVVGPGARSGLALRYENAKDLGPDRVAAAVGALEITSGPIIVVCAATAITIDAVSKDGEFLGGAIVPGIDISLDALFAQAAGLREVELGAPLSAIGRNTIECLQAGVIIGHAELIDGLCRRMAAELGAEIGPASRTLPAPDSEPAESVASESGTVAVVATGVGLDVIVEHSSVVDRVDPLLVHRGLFSIWHRNR